MIGWLFIDGENLSESLVRHGLAQVHFSAERSKYYTVLSNAETQAKQKKLNVCFKFKSSMYLCTSFYSCGRITKKLTKWLWPSRRLSPTPHKYHGIRTTVE
jgi:hypothetical protein